MMNFPPKDEKELFDILQFIKKSPFAENYWNQLKSLYKQAETAFIQKDENANPKYLLNILYNLIYRIDQAQIENLTSAYPTPATLRYMKRRAKRFTHYLYKNHTDSYFEFVSRIIYSNLEKPSLDLNNQWITMDILFGKSKRYSQKSSGYGAYKKTDKKYHLHQREEYAPEIWDQQINFVADLLNHPLPWQIHEFATKLLYHHQLSIPVISDKMLESFFDSPSVWLKQVAVKLAYNTFTFQGLPPALYAGMWFYCNKGIQKNIKEIDGKRPKRDKIWYGAFANKLVEYVMNELRENNTSKRVVKALKLLQKEYPKKIPTDNILPFAPALLQSNVTILNEWALLSAQKAPKEEARQWMLALGMEVNPLTKAKYKALMHIFLPKFPKSISDAKNLDIYIFQPSFFVADFGWRLADKITYWKLYHFWDKLFRYNYNTRIKQVYLFNAITSEAGADMFLKYYKQYSYGINYINSEAFTYILENALPAIRLFIKQKFLEAFNTAPWDHIKKLSNFTDREAILEEYLARAIEKDIFNKYEWYVPSFFDNTSGNQWAVEAMFKILSVCKLNKKYAGSILNCFFEQPQFRSQGFEWIDQLPEQKRSLFIESLGEKSDQIINFASDIPLVILEAAILKMNSDTLLYMVRNANEESWNKLSGILYQQLLLKENESGFWKNILNEIITQSSSMLNTRLLEDKVFANLFLNQKDESIIDVTEPEFEQLLLNWIKNNLQFFEIGGASMYKICTHKLEEIRKFAYQFAFEKGFTPVFGLQLLESKLPDAMEQSKKYFNAILASSTIELEAALMLIDSPSKDVRNFGMEFLGGRKENFKDNAQVLEFLSEHSDSEVHLFVAEGIERTEDLKDQHFVQRFDKEILRMKNRSRKAKEKIKQRISINLEIKSEVLIEMTQSGTKKDAEWAILQLTKKAIAGEETGDFLLY